MKAKSPLFLILALMLLTSTCRTTPPKTAMRADEPAPAKLTLHQAAKTGDIKRVKSLIASGADINAKDGSGDAALHYAVLKGHKQIVELLLRKGADVNAKGHWDYLYCATLLKKCNSFMRLTFQGNGPHGKGTSWSDDLRYENATFFKRPRFSRKSMRVC